MVSVDISERERERDIVVWVSERETSWCMYILFIISICYVILYEIAITCDVDIHVYCDC